MEESDNSNANSNSDNGDISSSSDDFYSAESDIENINIKESPSKFGYEEDDEVESEEIEVGKSEEDEIIENEKEEVIDSEREEVVYSEKDEKSDEDEIIESEKEEVIESEGEKDGDSEKKEESDEVYESEVEEDNEVYESEVEEEEDDDDDEVYESEEEVTESEGEVECKEELTNSQEKATKEKKAKAKTHFNGYDIYDEVDSDEYDQLCINDNRNEIEFERLCLKKEDEFGMDYIDQASKIKSKYIVTESLYERLLKRDYERYGNNNENRNLNTNNKKRKDLYIYSNSVEDLNENNNIIASSTSKSNDSLVSPFFKEEIEIENNFLDQITSIISPSKTSHDQQYDVDDKKSIRQVKQLTKGIILDPIDPINKSNKNRFRQFLIQRELDKTAHLNELPNLMNNQIDNNNVDQPTITTTNPTVINTTGDNENSNNYYNNNNNNNNNNISEPNSPVKIKKRRISTTNNQPTQPKIEPFVKSILSTRNYQNFIYDNKTKIKNTLNWSTTNIKNNINNYKDTNNNNNNNNNNNHNNNKVNENFIKFSREEKEIIYYYMIYYSDLLFYSSDKLWKLISENELLSSKPNHLKIGIFITGKLESNQSFSQFIKKCKKKYFKDQDYFKSPSMKYPSPKSVNSLKHKIMYKNDDILKVNAIKEHSELITHEFITSNSDLVHEESRADKLLLKESNEANKQFNKYQGACLLPQILNSSGFESLLSSPAYQSTTPYPTIFFDLADSLKEWLKPTIQELSYCNNNSDEISKDQVLETLRVTQNVPYDDWKPSKRYKKLYNEKDNNNNNNNNNNSIDLSILFKNLKE